MTKEMRAILDATPAQRMTVKILLVDCSDYEIAENIMKHQGIAGFHQKLVLMRAELARRYPEKKENHSTNIPIEYRVMWEEVCKPFRKLSRAKAERNRRETIQIETKKDERMAAAGGRPKESVS